VELGTVLATEMLVKEAVVVAGARVVTSVVVGARVVTSIIVV
jgi:hypothetical protein